MSTQDEDEKDQKGRWHPGVSGNPGGRPKGARNKTTMAAMALLEGEAEMLTRRAIDAARDGDLGALKLVLDRIIPPRRRPVVQIDLDKLDDLQDAAQAQRRVIQAALDGGLSLDEAERLSKLITEHMRICDFAEVEWRAQRYLNAFFRRCCELRSRLTKLKQAIEKGNIAGLHKGEEPSLQEVVDRSRKERSKLPKGPAHRLTLFVAALAYLYDCQEQEPHIERAWFALPQSERELLIEAQKFFPFIGLPG